tara:strand:- start:779 stop:3055 length:2277 start_codon:yes stop_codon:yes gene_type:complete
MFAQISGIVIESATLKPLSGVNLTAEKVGASTDKNGRFHLDVKAGTWIKISHVGYELKTVTAKDNMKIKMTLKILQSAEIIVRAGLTDESLQRTAASVTVLTKKDIKNVSNDHLQVLIDQIPNLNWAGGTSRPRYFQIRGIGERSHYFGEGAPNFSVGFVVDDMDLSGLGMLGQLYDLDQIELFRGPQSSVYGSNAVAGLILLRTSNPTDNFELKTQVSAGSGSHMGWNSLVNFKLSNDFSMRLSSVFNYNDGFRENVTKNLTNTNKREESLYRIKLGYSPNEKLDIIATFIYGKMNNGYDVWAPDNNTDFKTYSDSKGEDSQLTHGYSFRGNLNIVENIQLTSITSFTETDLIHAYDGDWADSTYWHDNHGFDPAIEGWSYSFFDKNEKNRVNLTQEFRLALTPLIMGIYYKNLKEQDEAIGYLFGGVATDAWSHFDFQAKAGYIQYGFDFSPTLKANANIRYEQNEYDYFGSSQGLNDNWEKEYLPPVECKTVNTMLGYRATFQYLLDEITSFYGTISNGYKSAGINQQPYLTDKARSYEPEFIQNFELGIKRISSTNQTQLTVFYSKRKNQQVSVSSQQVEGDPNSFLFYTGNATSGNLQGLEWEHSQIFSSSYKMNASVGYLNTWVNRFPYETSYGESYGGDREAAMAPEFMGSIGFDFHNESGFFMSALYSYKSAYYFSDSHNQKSKPYSLVNLTVGKISRNKTVKLWVKNLFDERYTVRGFYFGLIPPDYHDQLWKSYGDPRQVGITLDYNF